MTNLPSFSTMPPATVRSTASCPAISSRILPRSLPRMTTTRSATGSRSDTRSGFVVVTLIVWPFDLR